MARITSAMKDATIDALRMELDTLRGLYERERQARQHQEKEIAELRGKVYAPATTPAQPPAAIIPAAAKRTPAPRAARPAYVPEAWQIERAAKMAAAKHEAMRSGSTVRA